MKKPLWSLGATIALAACTPAPTPDPTPTAAYTPPAWMAQAQETAERQAVIMRSFLGDIAFAKTLPTRVVLDSEVRVGWPAPTGASVASALTDAPALTIRLSGDQQDLVPSSGAVAVTGPKDAQWTGVIANAGLTDEGELLLTLEAADGGPLCGKECTSVPAKADTAICSASIIVVPEETGPAVPAAALQSDASALPDAARARLRAGHAGFVFQDAVLDPARTILDNVREAALFAGMPDDHARERALGLCDRFGVGHRVDHRAGATVVVATHDERLAAESDERLVLT